MSDLYSVFGRQLTPNRAGWGLCATSVAVYALSVAWMNPTIGFLSGVLASMGIFAVKEANEHDE